MHTDLQIYAIDVLESTIAERQVVVRVAKRQRHAMRHVARVRVGEVRYGVLFYAVRNPVARVSRNSFDVDDAVRGLLLRPYQRLRLGYCVRTSQTSFLKAEALSTPIQRMHTYPKPAPYLNPIRERVSP